jgi:hypothetical protein
MKILRFLKPILFGLVCLGMVASQASAQLLPPAPEPVKAKAATKKVTDIALTEEGTLRGVFINKQAGPLAGETVVIRQGRQVVAETTTDKLGEFRVSKFRGGTYQLSAGKANRSIRVWTADAAPKSAKAVALLVSGETVTRGQGLLAFGLTPAAGVNFAAAAGSAGLTVANMNDIEVVETKVNQMARTTSAP